MTYDELLDIFTPSDINEDGQHSMPFGYPMFYALRSIVEMHKPKEYKVLGTFADGLIQIGCACGGWSYPCPTIQAIEKELT
jgi:hypothetical protein